jgi:hypothetical protein
MIVAYVTRLGYLHCSACVAGGVTGGLPVYYDAAPHNVEPCDMCGAVSPVAVAHEARFTPVAA